MIKSSDLPWSQEERERERFLAHLAPVAIFTYNRLEHTRQTIEALQRNIYAEHTPLIIFSDAPKTAKVSSQVKALRAYLSTVTGFKSLEIVERETNWGLAKNIIEGVTRLTEEYGRVIVLEDDIVTSPWFLKYMNDSLELYKDEEQVLVISGFDYPMDTSNFPDSFFMCAGSCWGWATWQRAWKFYERNPEKCMQTFSKEDIFRFNFDGRCPARWKQVIDNVEGRLNTWAIFQEVMIFKRHGLALFPKKSLVRNIGFDSSGEHCGKSPLSKMAVTKEPVTEFPERIEQYSEGYNRYADFEKRLSSTPIFIVKCWKKLCDEGILSIPRLIKKKIGIK